MIDWHIRPLLDSGDVRAGEGVIRCRPHGQKDYAIADLDKNGMIQYNGVGYGVVEFFDAAGAKLMGGQLIAQNKRPRSWSPCKAWEFVQYRGGTLNMTLLQLRNSYMGRLSEQG